MRRAGGRITGPRGPRVLWASTRPDGPGGIAAYVRLLQESPLWAEWDIRHVSTHRSGTTAQKVLEFARGGAEFVWVLAADRPVAVHLHMASFGSFARKSLLVWAARLFRVPVLIHVHGGYFDQFFAGSARPTRAFITATLQQAEVVIALGAGQARALAAIAPDVRIVEVPNPARVAEPAVQPGPGRPAHVVFIGDLTADKGLFTLLDAWSAVLDAPAGGGGGRPRPRLTIAGPGDVAAVERECALRALGDCVRVAGLLTPAQVQALLREAQILTLPSRYEGRPMAILEAMANGLCVVATAVGGIPQMLGEDCGLLVPPDDPAALATALVSVIDDARRRVALGEAGRRLVAERFDVDVVSAQIGVLYEEVAR